MSDPSSPDVATERESEAHPEPLPAAAFLPPPEPEPEPPDGIVAWRPRPGVLEYALRGYGPTLVVAGTLALGSTRFALHIGPIVGPMGVGLVAVAVLAIVGFVLWWYLEVHEDSADDHPRVPQWPDPADFEGLMAAAGNWLVAVFFAAAPLGVVLALGLSWPPSNLVLLLGALAYLPAALSGVLSPRKALGALPLDVARLIANDPLSILACLGFSAACLPAILTRAFWDAPLPIDLAADGLASFVLLLALRRIGVGRAS